MGDRRFEARYEAVRNAPNRGVMLDTMSDGAIVEALAAASLHADPYMANILATEATNRMDRSRAEMRDLPVGVCSLDLDGRILSANPAAEELLGRTQTELRGQDFDTLCRDGSQHGPRWPAGAYVAALREGKVVDCDSEMFYRQDGSAFPVSYMAAPTSRGGEPSGAVIAFRRTEPAAHARREQEESEARHRLLFEHNPDFVFSADIAGRIETAGPDVDADGGLPLETLVAEDDVDALRTLFRQATEGKAARRSIALVRRDGAKIRTSLLVMPIIVKGRIVGVYGTAERRASEP